MILANLAGFIKCLYEADKTLTQKVKKAGCLHCRSPLDTANYPRKARGIPAELEDEMSIRFSLCCRRVGCRRRNTPKSLRFYGAKVYWLNIMILAVLETVFEWGVVPRKTVVRWQRYFERLPDSRFWREKRGLFMPPLDEACLLSSLIEKFKCRDGPSCWMALFDFINPFCKEIVVDVIT